MMENQLDPEEMGSFSKRVTGIRNTIFISARGTAKHSPRVTVAIDPPKSLSPLDRTAAVTIDGEIIGKMKPKLSHKVRAFVLINQEALLEYWNYSISTDELQRRLKKI